MVHKDNTPGWLIERRERVFLVLAGLFICSMTLLNVIGITRFVQLGPMALAVGVLPYPLTFLCTDLICELYGQRRANFMVSVGLVLNLFIFGVMTLGNMLPAADTAPPWQAIMLANEVGLPNGQILKDSAELFTLLYACTSGAMFASMMAYIAAQYCDVKLFHFWKKLTKGKYLWIRNNFSTMVSQLVDSIAVISVTFWAAIISGDLTTKAILILLLSNYFFKVFCAFADTPFFYFFTIKLRNYLQFDNPENEYK
jgi:uncharacterized PurR-regulated membrane protein YhhQ (DUF165 family)